MAWYQDPSVTGLLGAIGGALISGGISVFIWRKTRKVARVDCAVSDPASLLSFSSNISDKLQVKYAGQEASSVYLFSLEVANTGTEPVENQPIHIRLTPGSHILDFSTKTEPEIGFGQIFCAERNANQLNLRVALLNPGDRVLLEVISLNNPNDAISVGLKNKGVDARVYTKRSAESVLSSLSGDGTFHLFAMMGALPLVGSLGRALTSIELARRIDQIAKKQTR